MITPGLLNDPLPARSSDKIKGAEKAGETKPHYGRTDDFHSLVEQGGKPGSDELQTDEDMPVTDCFPVALLLPLVEGAEMTAETDESAEQAEEDGAVTEMVPATDDDAMRMPSAPVVDTMNTARRAGRAASAPAADRPPAVVRNIAGEEKTGKTAQPVQAEVRSLPAAGKAAGGQGEKAVVENISRKGMETVADRVGAAEDNARSPVPQAASGRQNTGQDFVAPRLNVADLPAPATVAHPAGKPAQLEVGDTVMLKAPVAENTMLARIEAVEVLSSRNNGDMRQLRLQLTPENLGVVEARLRLHENGLTVELRAAQTQTAHILARDHEMLVTLLKYSGFKEDSPVSLTISDQNRTVSHRVAPLAQLTGEHFSGQNGSSQNEQDMRGGTQGSGQNGRGGNRQEGEGAASQKQYNRQQPDEADRESHAGRPLRGLVV